MKYLRKLGPISAALPRREREPSIFSQFSNASTETGFIQSYEGEKSRFSGKWNRHISKQRVRGWISRPRSVIASIIMLVSVIWYVDSPLCSAL